jgi:nucleoid-associated protein YgaU
MANRPLLLAIAGMIVALIAVGLYFYAPDEGPEPAPPVATQSPPPEPAKPNATAEAPIKPTFDVVRVNPAGDTVIAGRAAPGAKVRIFDGDTEIGSATADKRGEWVFVPEKPLAAGNRQLGLVSIDPNGHEEKSDSLVILVVPERNQDIAGQPGNGQALALRVPRAGDAASTVLQKPSAESELTVAIDAIDYDDNGRVAVSGHAPAGGIVRLYLDNKFVGQDKADAQGHWSVKPEAPVAPGMYSLRADLVDGAAKVIARAQIPFVRSAVPAGMPAGSMIVVQPGNSLWRLARRSYGEGTRYTAIFEANKEQIKDADLIYPGQVFALPTTN